MLRRYVHGVREDDPILWYEGGQWVRSYHSDHEGSIVAVANGPNGALFATDSYDEYGIPGAGNTGRFQYTGQAWIPELGMYYYKARMYSPTLGRFMQTDPIGYKDQNNLYAYVANDPVNHADPSGEASTGSLFDNVGGNTVTVYGGGFAPEPINQTANAAHPGPNQGSRGYLNLLDDEGRGIPAGHSVSEHVGRSDDQLLRDVGARDIGQVQ